LILYISFLKNAYKYNLCKGEYTLMKQSSSNSTFEVVRRGDDNFQGVPGKFGGGYEIQVIGDDQNLGSRLRLGGADREKTAMAVAAVLNAAIYAPEISGLANYGLKDSSQVALLGRLLSFGEQITAFTEGDSAPQSEEIIDLRPPTDRLPSLLGLTISTGSPNSDGEGPLVTVNRSGVAMLKGEVKKQ
jgi:hypothetical protein